jgi:MFS transporter, FSR family, fosmidomycin resistance protein
MAAIALTQVPSGRQAPYLGLFCRLIDAGLVGAWFMSISLAAERAERRRIAETTAFSIILALSFSHFLNDMMQSLLPALYPMLKDAYGLSFAQIGMITLTSQLISSLLQPVVGSFAVHRPQP